MKIIRDDEFSETLTAKSGEGMGAEVPIGHMILQSALTTGGFVVGSILIEAARHKWFSNPETLDVSESKHLEVRIKADEAEDFINEVRLKAEDKEKAKKKAKAKKRVTKK